MFASVKKNHGYFVNEFSNPEGDFGTRRVYQFAGRWEFNFLALLLNSGMLKNKQEIGGITTKRGKIKNKKTKKQLKNGEKSWKKNNQK